MGGFMVLVQFVANGRVEGSWAVRRRSRLRRHFWSFWGDGAVSYPVSWSVSGSGFMGGFMGRFQQSSFRVRFHGRFHGV